ncbi:MAG TPA: dihydrodipicolinate synthase family protein [Candidatus Cybelea sp.]|jgi:4-hydroxy-tetrahydrodipicolinate synthase|nr:dihydrodipicolinate synthase family protein [Candidatus Cybelea sp.]
MRGIWSAVLTPVDGDFVPDAAVAVPYYRELLERGCDGINLLGTTGEAMSFGAEERLRFMAAIASSGLPMERVMVGTGAASIADAVRLTRAAFEYGFAAALVLPPFFLREASDDGILAFYNALVTRTNPPRRGLLLYNFPRMSGVAFRAPLVARLLQHFPELIAGMKDSSNDPQLQSALLRAHSDFALFPGSESDLLAAKGRGVAGCISGSVALWPELANAVYRDGEEARARELTQRRGALDALPFVPAVRRLVADERREPVWARAVPPQTPLTADEAELLEREAR